MKIILNGSHLIIKSLFWRGLGGAAAAAAAAADAKVVHRAVAAAAANECELRGRLGSDGHMTPSDPNL